MSLKTIGEKLRIQEGMSILILNAPEGYVESLGVKIEENTENLLDFIQIFIRSNSQLEAELPRCKERIKPKGILWVTYPKLSSVMRGDVHRDSIRDYGESVGLKSIAMCAINETWSALRFKNK